MSDCSVAAREYVALGWRVIPIAVGQKTPAMARWPDRATSDPEEVCTWWGSQYGRCGVGIVTGRESGLFVLDVDPGHGGETNLRALSKEHGELPKTVMCLTGGGGRHFYFRMPDGVDVRNRTTLAGRPGLDIRGTGGYIVAPPSAHPSGGTYRWADSCGPNDVPVADAPDWLVELLCHTNGNGAASPSPVDDTQGPPRIPVGSRHEILLQIAGRLRREGLDPEEIEPVLLAVRTRRCEGIDDPTQPLPVEEVRRIAQDVGRYPPAKSIGPTSAESWLADACGKSLHTIMAGEKPPRPPAILGEGLLPERSVGMLFGPSNVGKTQVAIALALAVGGGRDFFGWSTTAGNVVYLCPELDLVEFWDRVVAIEAAECAARAWNPTAPAVQTDLERARSRVFPMTADMLPRLPDLSQAEDRRAVIAACRARDARLLLLDPFALVHTADENSNDEMLKVMRGLHEIRTQAGVTPLVVHHPRKGKPGFSDPGFDAMRGAGAIAAHARVILRLDEKQGKIRLSCPKATHSRLPDPVWLARADSGALVLTSSPGDARAERDRRAEAVLVYVECQGGRDVTLEDIQRQVPEVEGLNERTIRGYLQSECATEDGRIEARGSTRDRRWRART